MNKTLKDLKRRLLLSTVGNTLACGYKETDLKQLVIDRIRELRLQIKRIKNGKTKLFNKAIRIAHILHTIEDYKTLFDITEEENKE